MRSEPNSCCTKVNAVSLTSQLREVAEAIRVRKAELSKTVITLSRTWLRLSDAERKPWIDFSPEIATFLDQMTTANRTFADFGVCHVKLLELMELQDRVWCDLVQKSKILCSVLAAEMLAEMKIADMKRTALAQIRRQMNSHGLNESDLIDFYPAVMGELMSQKQSKSACSVDQALEARICLDLYDREFDVKVRMKGADTLDEVVRIVAESILLAEIEGKAGYEHSHSKLGLKPNVQRSEVVHDVIASIDIPDLMKLWAMLEDHTRDEADHTTSTTALETSVRNGSSLPDALRSEVARSRALSFLVGEALA